MTDGYGYSNEHLAATCVQCLFTSMNSDKHQAVVFRRLSKDLRPSKIYIFTVQTVYSMQSLIVDKFLQNWAICIKLQAKDYFVIKVANATLFDLIGFLQWCWYEYL